MLILILFAFIAGIVTVLSPCILPVLPIVLSGSVGEGRKRPFGVVTGFIVSFTFFTLFLSLLVQAFGISADSLRLFSIVVIIGFGLSLLIPQTQLLLEKLFSVFSGLMPKGKGDGFISGLLVGLSLGLIWTPCVGPILASVIALALTGSVNGTAAIITLAYAIGTGIPMLAITYGGRNLLQKVPWLLSHTAQIQKAFGIVMIATGIGLAFNVDRQFQTWVLQTFPQYGTGLTQIEQNNVVQQQLQRLNPHSTSQPQVLSTDKPESSYADAPDFSGGNHWLNSEPLTIADLKGKVVLVDFWTYSCINCIRTLPYVTKWYDTYKDKNFVVIGVHSPEFEFEKNTDNVSKAIADFKIHYPVVQDNDFKIWNAYSNQAWPTHYLIDAQGKIRYVHLGEGSYAETEQAIQQLIREAGMQLDTPITASDDQRPVTQLSPETYIGANRMQFFYPKGKVSTGVQTFTLASNVADDSFSFGGQWNVTPENSVTVDQSTLNYNFNASKVYLVLNPVAGKTSTVTVFLDGQPVPAEQAGSDVINGQVTVDSDRLYNLIDLKDHPGRHTLLLQFNTPGTEVFAFTFG